MQQQAVSEPAPFDPERLVGTLAEHQVRYLLAGVLAARLQGFPRIPETAEIVPARSAEDLDRLAGALRELDAKVHTANIPEGLTFDCTGKMLARGDSWSLATLAGRLNLEFFPDGTLGYHDLLLSAMGYDVFGTHLKAATLEDIIRSKKASDRPQDRQDVAVMREMMRQRRS